MAISLVVFGKGEFTIHKNDATEVLVDVFPEPDGLV